MNDLMLSTHPIWVAIQQHLTRNTEGYLAFLGALLIAAACMLPKKRPRTIDDWYDFFRDTIQTAVPAARAQREVHTLTETTTPTTTAKQEVTATTAADPIAVPPKES